MHTTHSSQHGFVAVNAYFEKCNILWILYFLTYTSDARIKILVPSVASKDRNLNKSSRDWLLPLDDIRQVEHHAANYWLVMINGEGLSRLRLSYTVSVTLRNVFCFLE